MKPLAYQTGTIELMPYTEHGEFCIVGVFAVNPETRRLAFRILEPIRTKRLTGFFPEMERKIFIQTLKSVHHEWDTLAKMVDTDVDTAEFDIMTGVAGSDLFTAITHPREGIIRHKARGVVLTDNVEKWLDQAFLRMVQRKDITTVIPEEQKLTKEITGYLKELRFQKQWKEDIVGNDTYHARFPLTYTPKEETKVVRAIKPLFLGYEDSTKLIEHGDLWIQKVRRLNHFNLSPEKLVFPVQLPTDQNGEQYEHAKLIISDLKEQGVHIIEKIDIDHLKPILMTGEVDDTPLFAKEG